MQERLRTARRQIRKRLFYYSHARLVDVLANVFSPKKFRQYYRAGNKEDPWLSYKHHGTESMMYGENGMFRYVVLLLLEVNL